MFACQIHTIITVNIYILVLNVGEHWFNHFTICTPFSAEKINHLIFLCNKLLRQFLPKQRKKPQLKVIHQLYTQSQKADWHGQKLCIKPEVVSSRFLIGPRKTHKSLILKGLTFTR
ncbi:hypothetical protein UGMREWDR_CDS0181 [Aeromonas phage GomatiRiver_11]|nr:hypothetical protein UGMREWDR_CDS0181 [Aeromonas phage GomatiRiver_11]